MHFLHISPDPRSVDDQIPCIPFWQIDDIILSARYILRRRSAKEVKERAGLIVVRIRQYEEDLVDTAEKIGVPFSMYPDDAALLQDIIMPDRAFPMRAPKVREDIPVPVVVESGWVAAEDFAVLALLKVDQSIDAVGDGTPTELLVSAGVLLEAYRCLLLAERARGRDVMVVEEYDEFKRKYLEQKRLRISEQNRKAPKNRKPEKLKASVLEKYRCMRHEHPEKSRNEIADELADQYLQTLPSLTSDDCMLSPANARRTISDWIKRSEHPPSVLPPPPNETHKTLRKKHQF